MLRRLIISSAFCTLVSLGLALGLAHLTKAIPTVALAAPVIECDSSSDPCVRVYHTAKDVEAGSYKVVKFTEPEIINAINKGTRQIHDKIKDETGFDCKKGKYEYGVYRCEEGALATRHDLLIKALEMLYG